MDFEENNKLATRNDNVVSLAAYKQSKGIGQDVTYAAYNANLGAVDYITPMSDDALIAFLFDAGIIGREIDDYCDE